jgi:hypothetical protein
VREAKKPPSKNTDVISASEIGQYHYCSLAWYLQKCGYEPISPFLETGKQKHEALGRLMDQTRTSMIKSRVLAALAYLLLAICFFIFLFEVIL